MLQDTTLSIQKMGDLSLGPREGTQRVHEMLFGDFLVSEPTGLAAP